MTEITLPGHRGWQVIGYWQEIGLWLDANMPNPPLPDPQRWSIDTHRKSIQFTDSHDALLFSLRWGN